MQNDNPNLRGYARQMRKEPTTAEQVLWRLLRNRRLAGFKFRRQHPFGPYILDGFCVRAKLVVEVDGSPHSTQEGHARDSERDAYLAASGILVLRFWNSEIVNEREAVLERIANVCAERIDKQTELAGSGDQ
jgi:adenine-specific DNA-methyltransferase